VIEKSDLYLKYWEEQRSSLQHCEAQRSTLSNLVLILSGAGIAFASRGLDDKSSLVLTIGLFVLGAYGIATTMKYYERYSRHAAQARVFATLLADELQIPTHRDLLKEARKEHKEKWSRLNRVRLNLLWSTLHAIVALTGVALSVVILAR